MSMERIRRYRIVPPDSVGTVEITQYYDEETGLLDRYAMASAHSAATIRPRQAAGRFQWTRPMPCVVEAVRRDGSKQAMRASSIAEAFGLAYTWICGASGKASHDAVQRAGEQLAAEFYQMRHGHTHCDGVDEQALAANLRAWFNVDVDDMQDAPRNLRLEEAYRNDPETHVPADLSGDGVLRGRVRARLAAYQG